MSDASGTPPLRPRLSQCASDRRDRRGADERRARDRGRPHCGRWDRRERSRTERGAHEHDLKGRALSPGFIDTHTHDDRIVLDAPDMLPKMSQGVTTVVTGNCGISLAPVTFTGDPPAPMNLIGSRKAYEFPTFADYARAIAETVPGVNVAALIGHSALRLATMSDIRVKASEAAIGSDDRSCRRSDGERRGGVFDRTLLSDKRGSGHRRGLARGRPVRQAWRRVCNAHAERDGADPDFDRRDADDSEARRHPGRHLAPQMRRPEKLGPHEGNAAGDRSCGETPAGRARRVSLHGGLDQSSRGSRHRRDTGS